MTKEIQKTLLPKIKVNYTALPIAFSDTNVGICIVTNYDGPYPSEEVLGIHARLRREYGHKFKVESRGYNTAVYIY